MTDEPLCIMGVQLDAHRPWEIATTISITTHSFQGYIMPMHAHLVQYDDGTRHYLKCWEVGNASQQPYMLSERRNLELYRRMNTAALKPSPNLHTLTQQLATAQEQA